MLRPWLRLVLLSLLVPASAAGEPVTWELQGDLHRVPPAHRSIHAIPEDPAGRIQGRFMQDPDTGQLTEGRLRALGRDFETGARIGAPMGAGSALLFGPSAWIARNGLNEVPGSAVLRQGFPQPLRHGWARGHSRCGPAPGRVRWVSHAALLPVSDQGRDVPIPVSVWIDEAAFLSDHPTMLILPGHDHAPPGMSGFFDGEILLRRSNGAVTILDMGVENWDLPQTPARSPARNFVAGAGFSHPLAPDAAWRPDGPLPGTLAWAGPLGHSLRFAHGGWGVRAGGLPGPVGVAAPGPAEADYEVALRGEEWPSAPREDGRSILPRARSAPCEGSLLATPGARPRDRAATEASGEAAEDADFFATIAAAPALPGSGGGSASAATGLGVATNGAGDAGLFDADLPPPAPAPFLDLGAMTGPDAQPTALIPLDADPALPPGDIVTTRRIDPVASAPVDAPAPVPLPASLPILLCGLGAIWLVRRRLRA